MKKFCLFLCVLCVVSDIALAQGKSNVQWKCDKPAVQHNVEVGYKPGHAYAIDQINCTAIKGEIAGVRISQGSVCGARDDPKGPPIVPGWLPHQNPAEVFVY
jgi:hypothetical protein